MSYTIDSSVGKKTDVFARFSTVAGERGAADAERDIRGFAVKFYTEEGNCGKADPAYGDGVAKALGIAR